LNQKTHHKISDFCYNQTGRFDSSLVSGNKSVKLKYNLLQAKEEKGTLITFGGAYSNHIAAVAFAGKKRIQNHGIVRGDDCTIKDQSNLTSKAWNALNCLKRRITSIKSESSF
jgi:1-aminocyclopropane-1-carboxylate deaminase